MLCPLRKKRKLSCVNGSSQAGSGGVDRGDFDSSGRANASALRHARRNEDPQAGKVELLVPCEDGYWTEDVRGPPTIRLEEARQFDERLIRKDVRRQIHAARAADGDHFSGSGRLYGCVRGGPDRHLEHERTRVVGDASHQIESSWSTRY